MRPYDNAAQLAVSERRQHPAARPRAMPQRLRQRIREDLIERHRQADIAVDGAVSRPGCGIHGHAGKETIFNVARICTLYAACRRFVVAPVANRPAWVYNLGCWK